MWSRRGFSGRNSELEAALRNRRAEATSDFVEDLAAQVLAQRPSARGAWSRVAFAAALTVFTVGTFASIGGLGYAAARATGTYDVVKTVVVHHKLKVAVHSSAAAQYPKPHVAGVHKPLHKAKKASALGQTAPAGTLPFTGFSLLATFLVSLALIGTGLALRRRERRS